MIFGRFHISEVSIWSPYARGSQLGWIQCGIKHFVLPMRKSGIRPPLSEENIYGIVLKLKWKNASTRLVSRTVEVKEEN